MVGGSNQPNPSTNKPPTSSSSNNDGGTGTGTGTSKNNYNKTTTAQKIPEKKLPKPNPSPKLAPIPKKSNPNPKPAPSRPGPGPLPGLIKPGPPQFQFPDSSSSAAPLGPPPPPTYGFHMLERRTIALVDGSIRTYFALPPNYQDYPPVNRIGPEFGRFHPDEFRSMKRKYPGDEEVEMMRQRQQLMQYGNQGGTSSSSAFGDDVRVAKHMRRHESGSNGNGVSKHLQVDQVALRKSFLGYVKRVYEDQGERKKYLENGRKGRIQCLVCARSPQDVQDTHDLVMHSYYSDDASSHVHHLGLHKALCVLMGWNFSKAPDNSKSYQNLPAEVAAMNQDQLIIWPPHVIVHNTSTGKGKEGRMEGFGNKRMDNRVRELGLSGGKPKSLYGRDGGHLGITLFKFAGDDSGLRDAMRMVDYFEKTNHGRKSWARVQPPIPSKDDEKNPSLVEVDGRTGEKKRILYGYLATITDLDKVDSETRKKTAIESLRELTGSK